MFRCEICGKEVKRLGTHVLMQHNIKPKDYYDKYLKKPREEICPVCGKPTPYVKITVGYGKFCSRKCSANSKDTRETYRKTCIEKYGVDNAWKAESVKDKIKETCLERYGVTSYCQTEECKKASHTQEAEKKKKETFIKKYGVDSPLKVPEIQQKVFEKSRITKQERYGDPNYNNMEKNKQTCLERYGVDSYLNTEENRKKCHSKEARKKATQTRKNNGTLCSSRWQKYLHKKLKNKFKQENIISEYYEDRYPFHCDFYIKSLDLFIELNGTWTHNDHWFEKNNEEDIKQVKKWKKGNTKYYDKAIETWTERDVKKREVAKRNKLNYVVLWDEYDIDEWFSLGCPVGQDWKEEYTWKK